VLSSQPCLEDGVGVSGDAVRSEAISEAQIAVPLGVALPHHVDMTHTKLKARLADEQEAALTCLVSPEHEAVRLQLRDHGVGWHVPGNLNGDVDDGLGRQARHGRGPDVLHRGLHAREPSEKEECQVLVGLTPL
jgi:hypothetical protein